MNIFLRKIYYLLLKILPKKYYDRYICFTIKTLKNTDALTFAYNSLGILKWQNEEISGEKFVIEKVLMTKFCDKNEIIFFDIGANIGKYCKMLSKSFPQSKVFAFEPNPNSYKILEKNKLENINISPLGFGNKRMKKKIFTYKDDLTSEHSSIFKDHHKVISEDLINKEIVSFEINITTLDYFCKKNNIDYIDFIKIYTEELHRNYTI
jgi:FkbM family methyltransferase